MPSKTEKLTEAEFAIASMSFADEFAENPGAAINKLQLLLNDGKLLAARMAFLEVLGPRTKQGGVRDYTRARTAILDTGLMELLRQGQQTVCPDGSLANDLVEELHQLSCDPTALTAIHGELLTMSDVPQKPADRTG